MREFTKEEKELIINTPITRDCFDTPPKSCLEGMLGLNYERVLKNKIEICEDIRLRCKNAKTKLDKKYGLVYWLGTYRITVTRW